MLNLSIGARYGLALLLGLAIFTRPAAACTGITLRPKDGSIIYGRTLEFGADLLSNVVIIPRGFAYTGTTPDGTPGLKWKSKYASVGANAFGLPVLLDGHNEKGLACGLFYFPGYAKYQSITQEDLPQTIAPWEVGAYILGTCSTIEEVTKAIRSVKVANTVLPQMNMVPPAHYIFTDTTGQAIAVEYVDGELKIHDNKLGVFTNAPTFDWHVTNLSNYLNLDPLGKTSITLGQQQVKSLGMGSGMLGLPGDFTPPSRFVRAVAFSKSALPVETSREGVLQLFHLLNQFDIPKGAARSLENGEEVADYTLWTSGNDLKNKRFYFRTFENSEIRMVDLMKGPLDGKEMVVFPMKSEQKIQELTAPAQKVSSTSPTIMPVKMVQMTETTRHQRIFRRPANIYAP